MIPVILTLFYITSFFLSIIWSKILETPLYKACENGFYPIVKLLVDAGADPNISDVVRITCTLVFEDTFLFDGTVM